MENSAKKSQLRSDNIVTYSMSFSPSAAGESHRSSDQVIAVGNFIEEYNNRVDMLTFDDETLTLTPNPPPPLLTLQNDAVVEPVSVLNNSKSSEFCAPLTSFYWNDVVPHRIGTSSIDTTCTIWDIEG